MPASFVSYLDECGDHGLRGGTPYLIEGGFVCPKKTESALGDALAELSARFYPGLREKKSSDLRNNLRGGNARHARSYLIQLMRLLKDHNAVVVASVHQKPTTRHLTAPALRQQAFVAVLRRAARTTHGDEFDVVHDAWIYAPFNERTRDRLAKLAPANAGRIDVRSSEYSPLLQAADHVTGAILMVCGACLTWALPLPGRPIPEEVASMLHEELESLIFRYQTRSGERASVEIHDLEAGARTPLPPPGVLVDR